MYYKIMWGFDDGHAISITSDELQKAFYCHLKGVTGAFREGSISGDKIIAVQPDYHRIMGWNTGYKLGALDYEELDQKGIRTKCQLELHEAKEKAQYRLANGAEMPPRDKEIGDATASLADKMRLK